MDEDWMEISHYLLNCLCLIVSLILVATFVIHVAILAGVPVFVAVLVMKCH